MPVASSPVELLFAAAVVKKTVTQFRLAGEVAPSSKNGAGKGVKKLLAPIPCTDGRVNAVKEVGEPQRL